jgi:hypothetical protein
MTPLQTITTQYFTFLLLPPLLSPSTRVHYCHFFPLHAFFSFSFLFISCLTLLRYLFLYLSHTHTLTPPPPFADKFFLFYFLPLPPPPHSDLLSLTHSGEELMVAIYFYAFPRLLFSPACFMFARSLSRMLHTFLPREERASLSWGNGAFRY